jgi:hypothetical protein
MEIESDDEDSFDKQYEERKNDQRPLLGNQQ